MASDAPGLPTTAELQAAVDTVAAFRRREHNDALVAVARAVLALSNSPSANCGNCWNSGQDPDAEGEPCPCCSGTSADTQRVLARLVAPDAKGGGG
jgi:hypothetical protein